MALFVPRMRIPFAKYQATGNDFVLVDNRQQLLPREAVAAYAHICHRRFGIGADGLILIAAHPELHFEMVYYNSDGRLGSMCGNGGRCAVRFAQHLGLIKDTATFLAYDGPHQASIQQQVVTLQMGQPSPMTDRGPGAWYIHTGSPHHVQFVDQDVQDIDIVGLGRAVRQSAIYAPEGTNVSYVQPLAPNHLRMRTYERGVEDETYSCGTGVTAAALVYATKLAPQDVFTITIDTPGGQLQAIRDTEGRVFLQGPAQAVFSGELDTADFGL